MVQANPIPATATDVEEEYDPNVIRRIIEYLRQTEEVTYTSLADVIIGGNPDSAGRKTKLVVRSPDGSFWSVEVDDAGVLSTVLLTDIGLRRGVTARA